MQETEDIGTIDETVDAALRNARDRGAWPIRFPAAYLGRRKDRIIRQYMDGYAIDESYDSGHYVQFKPREMMKMTKT